MRLLSFVNACRSIDRMRLGLRFALVAPLVCSLSCGASDEERKKITAEVEKKADERVARAEQAARAKADEAQRELEKAKAELAEVKSKLTDAVSQAQASVEEQAKAAEAALQKAREAFKEEGRSELAHLNKEVQELSSKSGKVAKASKASFQKSMKDIQKHQKTIAADIVAFDKASLDTFRTIKAKLDRDLAAMRATIRSARAKIPP
jgi:peptidoglycan DL-endopeptidase CwlO